MNQIQSSQSEPTVLQPKILKANQSFVVEFEKANVHNFTEFSVGLDRNEKLENSEQGNCRNTDYVLHPAALEEQEDYKVEISSSLAKDTWNRKGTRWFQGLLLWK